MLPGHRLRALTLGPVRIRPPNGPPFPRQPGGAPTQPRLNLTKQLDLGCISWLPFQMTSPSLTARQSQSSTGH